MKNSTSNPRRSLKEVILNILPFFFLIAVILNALWPQQDDYDDYLGKQMNNPNFIHLMQDFHTGDTQKRQQAAQEFVGSGGDVLTLFKVGYSEEELNVAGIETE